MAASPQQDERFRRLYDEHFEAIRAYCLRRLPVADANDAVAEVFLTAWRKVAEVPSGEHQRPWMFAVARNVVAHAYRSTARRSRLERRVGGVGSVPEPGPEMQTVERSVNAEVLAELDKLPPVDREVLQLKVWEELTAAQIADVVGLSVSATEKRISRAYKKLGQAVRRKSLVPSDPHSQRGGE